MSTICPVTVSVFANAGTPRANTIAAAVIPANILRISRAPFEKQPAEWCTAYTGIRRHVSNGRSRFDRFERFDRLTLIAAQRDGRIEPVEPIEPLSQCDCPRVPLARRAIRRSRSGDRGP